MRDTHRAHLALFVTTLIFGLHYTIAKSMMPEVFSPMQLIFLRLLGGVIIFWLFQRLFVPEKVERKDLIKLAICGMFGFALNQTLFYEGLNLTTPVDASLIHVMNPVLVLIFASLIIHEKVTLTKMGGIALGATGTLLLVLYGKQVSFDGANALGNILVLLNMVFYALYLVLIKPLVGKYHTTTILKWVSAFGFIFILPFSIKPALEISFATVTPVAWAGLAYIILLNTFVAYLLINYALKHLMPSVISYYNYIQPLIAGLSSLTIGQERITLPKVLAAGLIFTGVWLVNRRSKKNV
jgi:drug/metabolite transporter (DMT)-like permease